jgi:hypothetical protein
MRAKEFLMTTKSSDDRHVVHLHVDAETRTEIRMLAASRGTTIAEAITDLVHTEAEAVGIIRGSEGLPRWCREVAPVEWQCSGRGGRCPAEHLPHILRGVGPAHLHVDLNDVRLGLRAEVLQWLRAHVPAGVEVDDGQTYVLTGDLRDVLHDLLTGIL